MVGSYKEPLISVVVPVYGVELYLDQCISSIVTQTYRNIEIILVDDGSKDRCPQISDEWAAKDARIHVIHKANGGLSSARNAGMKIMHGEYVTFVDSDDWLEPEFIEMLYKAISLYDHKVAVCGFKRVYTNRETASRFLINSESVFYPCVTDQAVKYFFEIAIAVWGKLYHKSVVKGIDFVDGRLAEDISFQIEVLKRVTSVSFCNMHLYDYRIRENSIAHTIKPKYLVDHIQALSESYEACLSKFSFEIDYCRNWLSALLYEFLSADAFGKSEKEYNHDLLNKALFQTGGENRLLMNIFDDLGTVFYTYAQFREYMTQKEKAMIQADFRKQFSIHKVKKYGKQFFLKYIPSYISLEVGYRLSRVKK